MGGRECASLRFIEQDAIAHHQAITFRDPVLRAHASHLFWPADSSLHPQRLLCLPNQPIPALPGAKPQPRIGQVHPDAVSADEALALMVEHPILIRRPLLQVRDRCVSGFDLPALDAWIGLAPDSDLTQDLQRCPQQSPTVPNSNGTSQRNP